MGEFREGNGGYDDVAVNSVPSGSTTPTAPLPPEALAALAGEAKAAAMVAPAAEVMAVTQTMLREHLER